jgi:hypothetical protein
MSHSCWLLVEKGKKQETAASKFKGLKKKGAAGRRSSGFKFKSI